MPGATVAAAEAPKNEDSPSGKGKDFIEESVRYDS